MNKQEIVTVLKDEGLVVAEDVAVSAVKAAVALLKVLIPKISTGFGMAFVFFIDAYLPELLKLVDKIDGVDDPEY